jgi:hypothetical protein
MAIELQNARAHVNVVRAWSCRVESTWQNIPVWPWAKEARLTVAC